MTLLEIDPNVVKPGWTPLIITLLLAGAMVLLSRSMRRQFGKINVPDERSGVATPGSGVASPGPAESPDVPFPHTSDNPSDGDAGRRVDPRRPNGSGPQV
ncbi:MAG: hypothetical protein AVDCRST_MAG75-3238 [uncultured Propionibacteriaceae bacterium]|uniref:Uncharacterized protein n=1 Tax=uncultured Propionibacteriaceae bacterium TaxID=257457 RepID=A0A6J4PM37_9ACTN|nr:MAG: hypothetical protein AVDCRST_MAG75-3238 [uncultured Propionibacteriaceae bacterium]